MSVSSVQPSGDSPESDFPPRMSKAEQQKIDQLQWLTGLISTFVSVTGQKYGNQIEDIQKDINDSGTSPEKLVSSMNQLIGQINQGVSSVTALPKLASDGNMEQNAIFLQHVLSAIAEKSGKQDAFSPLLDKTDDLIDNVQTIPSDEAVNQLNQIIESANQITKYQIQPLEIK